MKSNKSRGMFLLDLFLLNAAFLGYYAYHHGFIIISYKYIFFLFFSSLIWLFISINSPLHVLSPNSKITLCMKHLFMAFSVLTVCLVATLAVFGDFKNFNKYILYPLLFAGMASGFFRLGYLIIIKHFTKNGYGRKSILVIGGDRVAERVINKIIKSPYLGYNLYGVLADKYHESLSNGMYLGKLDRFAEVVRTKLVDEVIIALPLRREKEIIDIVGKCNHEGVRFRIVPDFFRLVQNRMHIEALDDIPLISIQTEPLTTLGNRIQKRIFDIFFSIVFLMITFPALLAIAIIIKLTSPGPIIFKQLRMGANNKEFWLYKFRTMKVQDKESSDNTWTAETDNRVTKFGRFLRKTNLDELPQFWNVLIGNMSIVGPRPEREHFVEQFKEEIKNYKVRHLIKSGITGWAQVNGLRGDTSIPDRVKHDIFYIQHWSIWLDLKIIFLTVFNSKAYENAY